MTYAIEVKNLIKNYKNVNAVQNISFKVKKGSFFAFLGINGAGKSTTINILCNVIEKTSGSIKINGFDIDNQKNEIRKLIGIVFQNSVLDKELTVMENLLSRASFYGMSSKEAKNRIAELTKQFTLENILKQKYKTLSGGQKRRVDIARALINKPEILFLDEPTTGLDPGTRQQVWEIIHNLRYETGLTVFLTTHYMEETADCDNVVIIDSGKIVANDTPNNLKKQYARNNLIWYTAKNEAIEKLLQSENKKFEYIADAYKIEVESSSEASKLLFKYPQITDFEVIKGGMDDVFLNVTGKKAEI